MAVTYTPITTTTLASNQSSVTFNSFSGYTDLVIVCSIKITAGGLAFKPNNDSSSIYSANYLRGNGSTVNSYKLNTADLGGTGYYLFNGAVSNTNFTPVIINLQNYSNTTTYKPILARFNNTENYFGAGVLLAKTTSAITSLVFSCDGGGSIASGTTFTFYGILAA